LKEIMVSDKPSTVELRDWIEILKKEMLEVTKQAYGERAFDRWRNPLYEGALPNGDGYACLRSNCGDAMEIFLKFKGDRVSDASFRTAGCGAGAVCGSYAAEMALNKGPEEILRITAQSLLDRLGGLPREEAPMAELAVKTLHASLRNFMDKRESQLEDTLK
jgi:nitrogen fixation NifU-like protein